MRKTKIMPTKGQFVMAWVAQGVPWSTTYKWEDGKLYEFAPHNKWKLVDAETVVEYLSDTDTMYVKV